MRCNPLAISEIVREVKEQVFLPEQTRSLIPFIDLTSLNEEDNALVIEDLCRKAMTPGGQVAAICVYPSFVKQAARLLSGSGIKVATVANFPDGQQPLAAVLQEIEQSLQAGADEIDVVFPYPAFLRGEKEGVVSFLSQCKARCGSASMKVILETGAIQDLTKIAEASATAIFAGADFVKTSTGKIAQGASLEAAAVILLSIRVAAQKINRPLGFKAAGGIREPEQAWQYWVLAKKLLGTDWPTPASFRIGASSLMDKLRSTTP